MALGLIPFALWDLNLRRVPPGMTGASRGPRPATQRNTMTRSTREHTALKGAGAVLAALVLAACASTDSTAPVSGLSSGQTLGWLEGQFPGYVRACKASGPAGTYSFGITVVGGGDYTLNPGPIATVNFDGTNQVCAQIYNPILNASWSEGETAQITITELVPEVTGVVFDAEPVGPALLQIGIRR